MQPTWQPLKPGDLIDVIAPSGAIARWDRALKQVRELLEGYGYRVRMPEEMMSPTILNYAHEDSVRAEYLIKALQAEDSAAVWAVRGGTGATRLLDALDAIEPPKRIKPLIGFSDITALHSYLHSQWNWPSVLGVVLSSNQELQAKNGGTISADAAAKDVLTLLEKTTADDAACYNTVQPLNAAASVVDQLDTRLTGGNLTLIQVLQGCQYLSDLRGFTLLLEDIGLSPQQLERTLDSLRFSGILENCDGVILGEFVSSRSGEDESLAITANQYALDNFAASVSCPVFSLPVFGHGRLNAPLLLNSQCRISCDQENNYALHMYPPV
ncbi:LD-carboxypeptidase [Spongorhabdus nitratireducens]